MRIIQVIVVDDHYFFRQGLITFLNTLVNVKVVGEASNGIELLEFVKENKGDLIFMDIKMPEMDGIEATRRAKILYPDIKIIAISIADDEAYFNSMVEAGADGFLLKTSENRELERAINTVFGGDTYFSSELLEGIADRKQISDNSVDNEIKALLTSRELEILEYICKGFTNNEIAEKLFISPRTVDGHRANLLSKTSTKNTVSLVMFAVKSNLVDMGR